MGDFGTSVAVVVGIDTYAGAIPNLRTAVADAKAVASRLATEQGYVVELLVDEAATRAALLGLLEETLPRRLGPGDRVLFYFAGHGIAQDGDDGPEGYLLPVDAVAGAGAQTSFLPMARINAAFRALPCRHRFLMLDCCFAGSFRWAGHRSFAPEVPPLYRQRFRRFLEGTAAQVLVSAAEDQKALDLVDGLALGRRDEAALEGGHSPFAAAVLAGLSGAADLPGPDHQPDGVITATELYLYVRDQVELAAERRGARQTPGLWPLPEHGRGEYLFGVPGQTPRLIEDPRLDAAANPWRGLKAYERTHAPLFFGRDGEIAALQDRLTAAERLLVVLGASGTGKSSLVKAGLLPRLAAGWTVLGPERPGADPMGMVQRLGAGWVAAEGPVLAVVDQFEELFTHNASPGAVSRACHALEALLADGCRVLLTLRSDFEGRAQGTALGHRFAQARYVVPPMDRNGLRAVIEQPAQLRVLYFEPPELVDTLVDEVQALPGGLPLLSFTLAELYVAHVERDAGDRALRQADYDALGGVTGALQSRAEALYAAANPAEQESLRRLMLRAVTVDVDKVARRRVPLAELRYEAFAETRRTQAVVDRMVAARLLVSGANDDGVRYVEPAHDALVRGWHRVYEWLHAGADVLPLQRALRRQAVEWAGRGQPTSMLWHDDARLPQARQQGDALNALELAFVKASWWRRMRRRLKVWAAMLLLGLAGVFVARPVVGWVMQVPLTLMGHVQAHVATACAVTNLKQVELMAELAAGSPMPVQRLLGLARWLHLTLPALNITAPGRALAAGRDGVWAVQLSVEGRPVFITAEGEVRPDAAGFVSVAAGRRLALLARAGGGAEIWDQRSARRLRDLGGPDQPVYGGALAWDDGRALTTEIGGVARVWAVDTGAELTAVRHDGPLNAAALSAAGDWLATTTGGAAVRLTPVDGGAPVTLTGEAPATALAFSPAELRLIVGRADGHVEHWTRQADGAWSHTTPVQHTPGTAVTALAVSLDGWVASAGDDGSARLWAASLMAPVVFAPGLSQEPTDGATPGPPPEASTAPATPRWPALVGVAVGPAPQHQVLTVADGGAVTLWVRGAGEGVDLGGAESAVFLADGRGAIGILPTGQPLSWMTDPAQLQAALAAQVVARFRPAEAGGHPDDPPAPDPSAPPGQEAAR